MYCHGGAVCMPPAMEIPKHGAAFRARNLTLSNAGPVHIYISLHVCCDSVRSDPMVPYWQPDPAGLCAWPAVCLFGTLAQTVCAVWPCVHAKSTYMACPLLATRVLEPEAVQQFVRI